MSRFNGVSSNWDLVRWFNTVGLVVMILGTLVIGGWLSNQIESSIIRETAANTALYLDSFVTPNLQELADSDELTPEHFATLNSLLVTTDIGREIAAIKVWNKDGKILFSNSPSMIGKVFPGAEDLSEAWQGQVVSKVSDLTDDENVEERLNYQRLLEIYIPVRLAGTHQVIAVAEFYRKVDSLEAEIAQSQRNSWLAVGISMGVVYFWLVGFFGWARKRLQKQELALQNQVAQLTEVLSQNEELDRRMRRATAHVVELNEVTLRRISTELTNGPIQDVSASIARLETAIQEIEQCGLLNQNSQCNKNLPAVQDSLDSAMREMQTITTGLGLPHLEGMSLEDVFVSAAHAHEARTGTAVALEQHDLPDTVSLSLKIAAYRVVQEALNNSYRHAGGLGQHISATVVAGELVVEISDRGPGFETGQADLTGTHLGLAGMHERVVNLGGRLEIESRVHYGTRVSARFPLQGLGVLDV